ncbi:MAG: hypothetical protein JWO32_431 [Bacteroidetes bacterium]|nr:hypothetical protein [Bacteroidota bacterium]
MKKLIILVLSVASLSTVKAQHDNEKHHTKGEKKVEVITSNKTGWHKIGKMTASFKKERDVMIVTGADRFQAIKIKALDADIHLTSLEVNYENDSKQEVAVNEDMKKGVESREIALTGSQYKIKNITMVYKTPANAKHDKADLEVWGLKTSTGK